MSDYITSLAHRQGYQNRYANDPLARLAYWRGQMFINKHKDYAASYPHHPWPEKTFTVLNAGTGKRELFYSREDFNRLRREFEFKHSIGSSYAMWRRAAMGGQK